MLAGSEVLAGSDGLGREVSAVTVIDAPDGIQFIRGGELVLSTLFLYKGGVEDQITLIRDLHGRGAAGLGVKLERFVGTIGADVRACADQLCLPVVRLPGDLAWKDIINAVLQELLGRQARELAQSWEIHRRFIDLALEGRGLQELASALAGLVKNPVLVVETCTGGVFTSGDNSEGDGAPEPWLASAGEEAHPVIGYGGIRRISSETASPRLVCPIRTGRHQGGWIVVWEREGSLDAWGITALQHAATVAALEVEKLRALRNLERTMRDDFLHHLVRGDFESEATARERAWKLGWELAEAYTAVVFKLVSTPLGWGEERMPRPAWRVLDLLQGAGLEPRSLTGVDHAERPLVLFPASAGERPDVADDQVARDVRRLVGVLGRAHPRLELLAGVGRTGHGVRGVRESYGEAVMAVELAPMVGGNAVVQFRDLGIHRLVRDLRAPEVVQFIQDVLGPVLEYDRKHRTELLLTLRAFLEHGGNYRQAAQALYLHHSTVRYRLEQIEKLCGVKLSSARDRLNLQLALSLWTANNLYS